MTTYTSDSRRWMRTSARTPPAASVSSRPARAARPSTARGRSAASSETVIQAHGILRLKLDPALYEWEFVDVNGNTLDRGLNICH